MTRVFDSRTDIEDDILSDERYTSTQDINIPDIKDDSLELIEMAREHNAINNKKDECQVNALKSEKNSKSSKKKNSSKVIAGIVVGIIAVVAIVVAMIFIFGKGKKRTYKSK